MTKDEWITTCEERGVVCNSCQEDVNVHRCQKCGRDFHDGDSIYCLHHSRKDCNHVHKRCRDG